jgi:hypothetical protein
MAARGRRRLGEKAKGREARCRVLGFFVMMDELAVEQAEGWRESESRGEGDLRWGRRREGRSWEEEPI